MKRWLVVLFSIALGSHAWANYAENPDALALMHDLALTYDYDEAYLQSLLLAIDKDETVLKKISAPAEKTKAWYEYRAIFLDEDRINNGVAFWQQNADVLAKAEQEFGVDASIIVAIIGVETRYGKVTGSTPVLQALATLCFDYPPRAPFFCEQLDYMLQLSKAQDFNPLSIQGSYAGAMGMAQFMPSSYLNDAIDYDEDGTIDLWHSADDAIGSIAQYLANRDWKQGGQYADRLPRKPALSTFGETHFPHLSINDLVTDDNLKDDENVIKKLRESGEDVVGSLVLQEKDQQQWWITYHNFTVITKYNTSPLYAMAVIELADDISTKLERE